MTDFGVAGRKTRRFFTTAALVDVGDNWAVELDGRPVRTPGGKVLEVQNQNLGSALVDEWNAQVDEIDPRAMPLCGLANATIDRIAGDRDAFIEQISKYSNSDQICYWADGPPDLVSRQQAAWQPLLNWADTALDAKLTATSGIIHITQPPEAILAITARVEQLSDYELAGVTDLATSLSSVILALAVLHGEISADQAFDSAMIDELYQAEKWGEDSEAITRHRQIKADVLATARFLELIR